MNPGIGASGPGERLHFGSPKCMQRRANGFEIPLKKKCRPHRGHRQNTSRNHPTSDKTSQAMPNGAASRFETGRPTLARKTLDATKPPKKMPSQAASANTRRHRYWRHARTYRGSVVSWVTAEG